jgi:hypothetical protein
VGTSGEIKSQLGDVATVVGNQAFAFLVDEGMFDKLAVRLPESGVPQACCTST